MNGKVAIVTGSNKGIGYGIVKGLCEKFSGKVYLTSRDEQRGKEAIKKLQKLGLNPIFHQLDITDQSSIDKFHDYIQATDGGINILVNNAAIAYKNKATEPFSEQAEVTLETNYFATLNVCNSLFTLLKPNAQVVNVSSSEGHLFRIPSKTLRSKFSDEKLTIDLLSELMKKFVSDVKNGKHAQEGWGNSAYAVSKVGLSALTIIQQRNFYNEDLRQKISVNSVHPGYVDTDMSSHRGPLTIEEGAKAPLYLALGGHNLEGQFVWNDCRVVDWYSKL